MPPKNSQRNGDRILEHGFSNICRSCGRFFEPSEHVDPIRRLEPWQRTKCPRCYDPAAGDDTIFRVMIRRPKTRGTSIIDAAMP